MVHSNWWFRTLRPSHLGFVTAVGLCATLGASHPGASAPESPVPVREPGVAECRWADAPIRIDGKGSDAAWRAAAPLPDFTLPWLGANARPARAATRARLLWDRESLYFLADMDDGDLFADVFEHDGKTWDNDVFELFFKPADDQPGYYEFQVNAAGTVMDMFLPRRGDGGYTRYRKDGEFHLESKVELRGTLNQRDDRDSGWTVEGRIPWRDFHRTGDRPEVGERWKFALCRYDYDVRSARPELSTSAPLKSRADFHHYEEYGVLQFVGPGKAPSGPSEPRRVGLLTQTKRRP